MSENLRRMEELIGSLGREWEGMRSEIVRLSGEAENFKAVVFSSTDPVITADVDGKILTTNPAALKLLGYTERELLGRDIATIMPERYRARHRAGLAHYKATGEGPIMGKPLKAHALLKSGKEVAVEIMVSGHQGDTGRWVSASLKHCEPADARR